MPHRRTPWFALALAVGALAAVRSLSADDSPKDKGDAKPSDAKTVKAEKAPLVSVANLKGAAEAEEAAEVSVRPKAWSGQLLVRKAVEHGATVKAGDVLIEFEADKLDRDVRDARQERELAELAIRLAELELPVLEKQLPLEVAAAERRHKRAVEDQRRFLDIDRRSMIQNAEFYVRRMDKSLEEAKEELAQLRKMYRDKDLTEETEQMILKRYEFYVEMYEFYAAESRIDRDRTLSVELPRYEEDLKNSVAASELDLSKTRDAAPLNLHQKRLNLARLRYEEQKAKEKLAELEADRAALTVRAPAGGVVYYGRNVRGKWTVPAGPQGSVLAGSGAANPGDVLLTVVNPSRVVVRAEVEEKDLPRLRAGLTGRLSSPVDPDRKRPARLARVSPTPLDDGKFEVRIEPEGDGRDGLTPGTTYTARFVTAQRDNAVTVPASAVFEDDADESKYVYKPVKSGKPEKRAVNVGLTVGDRVEILDGLTDGDEILAAKP